jgi:hypothetical protein
MLKEAMSTNRFLVNGRFFPGDDTSLFAEPFQLSHRGCVLPSMTVRIKDIAENVFSPKSFTPHRRWLFGATRADGCAWDKQMIGLSLFKRDCRAQILRSASAY